VRHQLRAQDIEKERLEDERRAQEIEEEGRAREIREERER
jgi:hypothetical protein